MKSNLFRIILQQRGLVRVESINPERQYEVCRGADGTWEIATQDSDGDWSVSSGLAPEGTFRTRKAALAALEYWRTPKVRKVVLP